VEEKRENLGKAWMTPGSTSQTYEGHCHCGLVRYTVTLSPPLMPVSGSTQHWTVTRCNCSICARNGHLNVHPYHENVKFTKGQEKLKIYQFADKKAVHMFCTECGSSIGTDLTAFEEYTNGRRYAMNVSPLPRRL